jgi:hypothetical protein
MDMFLLSIVSTLLFSIALVADHFFATKVSKRILIICSALMLICNLILFRNSRESEEEIELDKKVAVMLKKIQEIEAENGRLKKELINNEVENFEKRANKAIKDSELKNLEIK